MEKKKRNRLLIIVGILLIITIIIGASYAYIMRSVSQTDNNLLMTQCLDIELTNESAAINVEGAYPISDENGIASTPYTFTVRNTCSNTINYNISLEVLNSDNILASKFVDVKLDDNDFKTLDQYETIATTYEGAIASYKLSSGILGANASKSHEVRMWIDEDAGNEAQHKSFLNKITVSATLNYKATDVMAVGNYVQMTPTSTSYTIPGSETGNYGSDNTGDNSYFVDQTINPSKLNLWRVIKINDNGTVEMVSANVSEEAVWFAGEGYQKYIGTLNKIAKQYENNKYTIGSRYMGYSNQTEYVTGGMAYYNACSYNNTPYPFTTDDDKYASTLDDCESYGYGDKGYTNDVNLVKTALGTLVTNQQYWIASRYMNAESSSSFNYTGRYIRDDGELDYGDICMDQCRNFYDTGMGGHLRPIVILKSGIDIVDITSGDGTSTNPYVLK